MRSRTPARPPRPQPRPRPQLDDDDYIRLAELRHGQRRFLHWSARQAERAGITPTQHQLLLGLRAWMEPDGPTMQDVADFLLIRHNSAVELVDRAQRAGLVTRRRDGAQVGQVLVEVTELGARRLEVLTEIHLRELAELAPTMSALWDAVAEVARDGAEA
jgi:DNA-binding MarR family transcriptional regulator